MQQLLAYGHANLVVVGDRLRRSTSERGQGTVEYVGLVLLVSLLMVGMVASMKGFTKSRRKGQCYDLAPQRERRAPRMEMDGYIRVSRRNRRSGESFISPKVQEDTIAQWAKLRNIEIAHVETDIDQGGETLQRPGLDRIMERIRAGKINGIVVAELDRLSRAGVGDALKLVKEIHDAGAKLVVVDLGIDPTTPMGKFGLTVMLAMAEVERERITEKWATARDRAFERNVYLAVVPFGYRKDAEGRLEPDPKTAPLAVGIFEKRAKGDSWASICQWLEDQGAKTPQGNNHWSVQTVKWIVGNRAYLGESKANGHTKADAHKALLSPDLFRRATRTRRKPAKPSGRATGLLSGILRCAGCRYAMKLATGKTRHGKPYREYRCKCRAKGAASDCKAAATIRADAIDAYVDDFVRSVVEGAKIEATKVSNEIDQARSALEAAECDLRAWEEASKGLPTELLSEGLQARIKAVDDAHDQLAAVESRGQVANLPASDDWDNKSLLERREAISAVVDSVFVWRTANPGKEQPPVEDRTVIYPAGEGPSDLPRKGRRWQAKPLPFPS